jgi:hypothetical protein
VGWETHKSPAPALGWEREHAPVPALGRRPETRYLLAMSTATLRLGDRTVPVVLPSWRDPRLLVSSVVLSVLAIGVTTLGFRVSIPQILAALLAGALIEGGWTLYRTGKLVWPASALNTVAGIALIMRVAGTESGDYWSWRGWYLFVLVGAVALLSKYVVRYHGTHVFNPSNIALVAVFLILGSSRVEPLDFWWAPLSNGWMVVAYAIILTGGLFIAYRLDVLPMPVAFWLTLAAGLGVLAASGHCFTARWSLDPVCGSEFWWVVVISPEILFFLFFMITDPKTIPAGRVARVVFAVCIALLCTLLIAPQTTEFGAKVALLAGLALMSPLRGLLDRAFPAGDPGRSRTTEFLTRITTRTGVPLRPSRSFRRGAVGGALAVAIALVVVAAGTPAREQAEAVAIDTPIDVTVEIDPATLPTVTVDEGVAALNGDITPASAQDLAVTLAERLEIEAEAMRRHESGLLLAADIGPRLAQQQDSFRESEAGAEWLVAEYTFESLHLRVVEAGQFVDLGFDASGTVETVTYDADGGELARDAAPFSTVFVLSKDSADRWLILDEVKDP